MTSRVYAFQVQFLHLNEASIPYGISNHLHVMRKCITKQSLFMYMSVTHTQHIFKSNVYASEHSLPHC